MYVRYVCIKVCVVNDIWTICMYTTCLYVFMYVCMYVCGEHLVGLYGQEGGLLLFEGDVGVDHKHPVLGLVLEPVFRNRNILYITKPIAYIHTYIHTYIGNVRKYIHTNIYRAIFTTAKNFL